MEIEPRVNRCECSYGQLPWHGRITVAPAQGHSHAQDKVPGPTLAQNAKRPQPRSTGALLVMQCLDNDQDVDIGRSPATLESRSSIATASLPPTEFNLINLIKLASYLYDTLKHFPTNLNTSVTFEGNAYP